MRKLSNVRRSSLSTRRSSLYLPREDTEYCVQMGLTASSSIEPLKTGVLRLQVTTLASACGLE